MFCNKMTPIFFLLKIETETYMRLGVVTEKLVVVAGSTVVVVGKRSSFRKLTGLNDISILEGVFHPAINLV